MTSKVTKNSSRISLTVSVRGSYPARYKSLRTYGQIKARDINKVDTKSISPNQFHFNPWSHDLKKRSIAERGKEILMIDFLRLVFYSSNLRGRQIPRFFRLLIFVALNILHHISNTETKKTFCTLIFVTRQHRGSQGECFNGIIFNLKTRSV